MKYTVKRIEREASYAVMSLVPSDGDMLEFEAGQYVAISAGGLIATPTRCFSIVSAPGEDVLQIAFRQDGDFTRGIAQLQEGANVDIMGPFGDFVLDDSNHPVVMLASGIGVTPFVSILRAMVTTNSQQKVIALISGRSLGSLPFYHEIEQLIEQLPNARLGFFSGSSADGRAVKGKINRDSLKQVAQMVGKHARYFICGPESFSATMTALLDEIGIDEGAVKTEAFAQARPSQSTRSLRGWVVKLSAVGFVLASLFVIALDFIGIYRKNQAAAVAAPASQAVTPAASSSQESSTASADTQSAQAPSYSYTAPSTTTYSAPVSVGS